MPITCMSLPKTFTVTLPRSTGVTSRALAMPSGRMQTSRSPGWNQRLPGIRYCCGWVISASAGVRPSMAVAM
jgi:hypothetical protein